MTTFAQIRRMMQLAPAIAIFLFVSDSAEASGTAMTTIAALQTSNFDSVGRDRIWIGQQSLALPVSKVSGRPAEIPDHGGLLPPLCYAISYLSSSFSCDIAHLFLTTDAGAAAHSISSCTVVYPTDSKVVAPFTNAFDFAATVAWGYSCRDVLSTH